MVRHPYALRTKANPTLVSPPDGYRVPTGLTVNKHRETCPSGSLEVELTPTACRAKVAASYEASRCLQSPRFLLSVPGQVPRSECPWVVA